MSSANHRGHGRHVVPISPEAPVERALLRLSIEYYRGRTPTAATGPAEVLSAHCGGKKAQITSHRSSVAGPNRLSSDDGWPMIPASWLSSASTFRL